MTSDNGISIPVNTAARSGFSIGLAAMFFFGWPFVGPLLCVSAIWVSAIGLRRHRPGAPKKDKVLAIIGLILGVVYSLMVLIWVAIGRM